MKRKIALFVSILSLSLMMLLPVKAAQLNWVADGAELFTNAECIEMKGTALPVTEQIPGDINFVEYEYEDADEVSADESEEGFSWGTLAIVILAPLLVAGVVSGILLGQMKTAVSQRAADNFIPDGGVNLTMQTDQFLFKTETRTKIEKKPSSDDS